MEKTLVLIKPDAVFKKNIGRILMMYEENGLYIDDMYMARLEKKMLEKHYSEHKDRDFYNSLLLFMTEGKVVVIKISGENAVKVVRDINGTTNPSKANPGTIRYLFGENAQRNAVHGSATLEDSKRELDIWFNN